MNTKIVGHLCLAVMIISLLSCEKHLLDKRATLAPYTLKIDSPLDGATYRSADSISISGTAIFTQSIHGYDIKIREWNDTSVKYFAHIHEHNDTLAINHKWKNSIVGKKQMEAEVILYLDHDGNVGSKKVLFNIE